MIYLLALIATVPVIVAFQVGLLFGFSFAVWVLLGDEDSAGTAEQDTERKKLAARRTLEHDDAALGYANLTPQGRFQCVITDCEYSGTFLTGQGFLIEG